MPFLANTCKEALSVFATRSNSIPAGLLANKKAPIYILLY
jgi:hypothetical protein